MTRTGYRPGMGTGGTAVELSGRTWGRRWWWALLAGVVSVGACGSDTDDLDEGPGPPEAGTEVVPGEGGPVD